MQGGLRPSWGPPRECPHGPRRQPGRSPGLARRRLHTRVNLGRGGPSWCGRGRLRVCLSRSQSRPRVGWAGRVHVTAGGASTCPRAALGHVTRGGSRQGRRWRGRRTPGRGCDVERPASARPGPPASPLHCPRALEGRGPQQRPLAGPWAPCPGHCGGGAPWGPGCSRHPAGRVTPAQLLHGDPREGCRVPSGGAAESPEGAEAEGCRVREAEPRAGAAGAGAGGADGQPVRGGTQDGSRGQREAGGLREAAEGGPGQDRHAPGGGDRPEDPGYHIHASLPQPRAAPAAAEPDQGWAPQGTLAAQELQQRHVPCCRTRPPAGQGGQGGGLHAVRRVPGLAGGAHAGQGLPLLGQGAPRGRGPLPGLRHARALSAGAGRRGGQHAHHRARGLTLAARHKARHGVCPHQHVRPERAEQNLPPPHPAGGLREPLLHLTILPGQDYGGVQLLHLHPLHPAGPGAAGCGTDVLGGHKAAEGDVAGQAGLLPPGGLGRSRPGAAPASGQLALSHSCKEGPTPTLDGRKDRRPWSSELSLPHPARQCTGASPESTMDRSTGLLGGDPGQGTSSGPLPPLALWQPSLLGRTVLGQPDLQGILSPCPSTPSILGQPRAPAFLPQGQQARRAWASPTLHHTQWGAPQRAPPLLPPHPEAPLPGWGWALLSEWAQVGPGCPPTALLQIPGSAHWTPHHARAPPGWNAAPSLFNKGGFVGGAWPVGGTLGSGQASGHLWE